MKERLLALIRIALKYRAKRILFEIRNGHVEAKALIDGELRNIRTNWDDHKLLEYLKRLACIDAHSFCSQVGHFKLILDGELINLSYSCVANQNVENCVLEIESKTNAGIMLFTGDKVKAKQEMYLAAKAKMAHAYTIEQKIDTYVDELIQLAINEEAGFGYCVALKQVLRHNPDLIMIDNISSETIELISKAVEKGVSIIAYVEGDSIRKCLRNFMSLGGRIEQVTDAFDCEEEKGEEFNWNRRDILKWYEAECSKKVGKKNSFEKLFDALKDKDDGVIYTDCEIIENADDLKEYVLSCITSNIQYDFNIDFERKEAIELCKEIAKESK